MEECLLGRGPRGRGCIEHLSLACVPLASEPWCPRRLFRTWSPVRSDGGPLPLWCGLSLGQWLDWAGRGCKSAMEQNYSRWLMHLRHLSSNSE